MSLFWFKALLILLIAAFASPILYALWKIGKSDLEDAKKRKEEGDDDEPPSGTLPIASKHFYRNTVRFGAMNIGR